MRPTAAQIAAGVATVSAILGGIVAGVIIPTHPDGHPSSHVRIEWDGEVPADVTCSRIVAAAPSEAWALMGLAGDGRPDLAVGYVCAPPLTDAMAALAEAGMPTGIRVLDEELAIVPFESGMARLELWAARHTDAPRSGCACSPLTASTCEWLVPTPEGAEEWKAAPPGSAHQPDRWRGGCVEIPTCYDMGEAGIGATMPVECTP